MKTPKIPKQNFERLKIESLHLTTSLEESNERFEHLIELDKWRTWVTEELEKLRTENGALRIRIRTLERKTKHLKG